MRSWIPRWNKAAKMSCVTGSVLPTLMSLAMATSLPLLLLFWPCQVAHGILVLQLGIKPEPLHWECRVSTNGPPGKSESLCLYFIIICLHGMAWGILVPWSGVKPMPPAVEVQSPNHWMTREVSIPLHLDVAARWIFFPSKVIFYFILLCTGFPAGYTSKWQFILG